MNNINSTKVKVSDLCMMSMHGVLNLLITRLVKSSLCLFFFVLHVLYQCFTKTIYYHFYNFREWKCALSWVKRQKTYKFHNSYLLEETFSHYFYKFLGEQAKKKNFFLKICLENRKATIFFCKNQGGKTFVKSIASRLVSGKYL